MASSDSTFPSDRDLSISSNPDTSVFRSIQDVVFVDVGQRVIDAQVVRDGLEVGVFQIDPERFNDIFIGRPEIRTRIVQQSIPAGTPVPVGTAVNLVVAQTGTLPTGMITGVLTQLAERPLAEVFTHFVAGKDSVNRILARVGTDNTLPPVEEAQLRQIFADQHIELTDEPGRNVAAAIETLRAARTFGS